MPCGAARSVSKRAQLLKQSSRELARATEAVITRPTKAI